MIELCMCFEEEGEGLRRKFSSHLMAFESIIGNRKFS